MENAAWVQTKQTGLINDIISAAADDEFYSGLKFLL
jgi:hypothetical protein